MPRSLTVSFNLGNGASLAYSTFHFNGDTQELSFDLELRTGAGGPTSSLICRVPMSIKNGTSTVVTRNASPAANLAVGDRTRYFVIATRSTPTGYTAAKTAERAAADTDAARRTAMEAHVASAGHVDPVSLANT